MIITGHLVDRRADSSVIKGKCVNRLSSMPKRIDRRACVPERVLQSDGNVETVMLDGRYRPYTAQPPRVENLCGSFREAVQKQNIEGVLIQTQSEFGKQREVFSIHGNVTLNRGKAAFMGVRNMEAMEALAKGLGLSGASNAVHMAVICGKTGRRMQVKSSGLLENHLILRYKKNIRIEGRMYDHTNTVRMSITNFSDDGGVFDLDKAFHPEKNDWTITGRGTVMIRFTWRQIEWTRESEAACLALCNRVILTCFQEQV